MDSDEDYNEYFIREKQNANMVRNRLIFVMSAFAVLFFIVAMKATEVTVLGHSEKKSVASSKKDNVKRSEIVDRNGNLLATNLKTSSIYANPKEILNFEETVTKLSDTIPKLDAPSLMADLDRDTKFVWIKRNITPKEQKAVNDLGLPGIYFIDDKSRVYPHGNLLSHILGYVDVDNKGLAGIEREFDELLSKSGKKPLQLSVDLKLQHILRDELAEQMVAFDALGASGMIVSAKTGEVMAMVSLPDFDPNKPSIATPEQKFNRLTLGIYEMGSTVKPITAAMALDNGTATMNSRYDASKPLKFGRHRISDYHAKNRVLTLPEVIMYSSNIGSAKMALDVGAEKHKAFLRKLGLFDRVEIEIPEKTTPIYPKKWRDINTVTASFGHGFAVSPIHLAKAFMAVLNGGNLHPITLLKIKMGDEIKSQRVVSEQTSLNVRKLLRMVVEGGSGKNANAEGYLVGGKTGTAEKIINGKYDKGRLMSSFAGAFPMDDPEYVVIAIFDEPQQQEKWVRPTGGIVAAPVIKRVISRAGPSLGMMPENMKNLAKQRNINANLISEKH